MARPTLRKCVRSLIIRQQDDYGLQLVLLIVGIHHVYILRYDCESASLDSMEVGVDDLTSRGEQATTAWFYPGQSEVGYMLSCPGSVAAAVASGVQNALVL